MLYVSESKPPKNIFFIEDYYFEEGQIVFKRMERCGREIDGIFCAAGDIVASGIMLAAKSEHVNIPGEISIIGYDDIVSSSMIDPPLTSVRQPLFQIGKNGYANSDYCQTRTFTTLNYVPIDGAQGPGGEIEDICPGQRRVAAADRDRIPLRLAACVINGDQAVLPSIIDKTIKTFYLTHKSI